MQTVEVVKCSYITQVHLAESFCESICEAPSNLFQNVSLIIVAKRPCDLVV